MDREGELRFDARGLLRNEARLQADLRVASMPDELDPDEIVQRDPEEWPRLIAAAKPIVTHVMDTLVADRDVNDPKVKSAIAAQVLPLIEDLPDPVERDTYRQQLSRLLRVDERSLIGRPVRTSGTRRSRSRRETRQQLLEKPIVSSNPSQRIEAHCLNILLRRPELLYRLDRQLQESSLGALNPEDFGYTDHQILLRLIQQAVQQDEEDALRYVTGHMPDSLGDLSQELLAQAEKLDPLDERNLEELVRNVIQLRRLVLGENLNQLRFLQEEAQQQGDLRATSYQELVLQHTRLLRDLDQAGRKLSLRRVE
jgi:DNA primase